MKHKNHDKIVQREEKIKSKHLEKLANKMLEKDEQMQKLGQMKIKKSPFDFFK